MSVKLIKAGETPTINPFSPPSVAKTNRPVQFAPTPSVPPPSRQAPGTPATTEAPETAPAKATGKEPGKGPESTVQVKELLAAASAKADGIVRTARAEAERQLANAQARVAELEADARARGLAEAQAVAHAQAQEELQLAVADLRQQLTATLDELAGLREQMAARAEQDLVRLALEIAKKVVQREVRVDHEIVLTLARVALGRLHSRANATVRLHPDDYAYVWSHRERLNSEGAVEIVEDRTVGLGGCIVQSELGEIDARIEQQFAEIEQEFLSV
ncbi:MAG: hypothetical protein HYR56_07120 [Acidobacteria bacterium]|nr:hypothetical protein [Acidobacteriota bacterium]MBI3426997.1 hypothetical protein [Acidobacteriota bacterium]